MGLPRINSLNDLTQIDADLKVTCLACRHVAIFAVWKVITYFYARGWNVAWEVVSVRFRCGRCGSKRIDCGIAPAVERPIPPQPEPIKREPNWREVKEHIRRTRG